MPNRSIFACLGALSHQYDLGQGLVVPEGPTMQFVVGALSHSVSVNLGRTRD